MYTEKQKYFVHVSVIKKKTIVTMTNKKYLSIRKKAFLGSTGGNLEGQKLTHPGY